MTTIYLLFALFVVLQIGDIATTVTALRRGGSEANPVMAKIMDQIGVVQALVLAKAVSIAIIGAFVWVGWMTFWLLALCCVFYVAIVGNNLYQMKRSKP